MQLLSFPRGNHLITAHHCNYHGTQRDSRRQRWAGSCRAASARAGSVPAVCELWCTHGTAPTAGKKALLRDPTALLLHLPKLCFQLMASKAKHASARVSFSSLVALPLPRPLHRGFASFPELGTHDCTPSSDCTLYNIYYCTADRKKMLYKGYHAPTFAFSCNNIAFLAPVQPTRCCSLSSVLATSACRRSKWRKQNLNCFWEGEAKLKLLFFPSVWLMCLKLGCLQPLQH